MLKKAEIIRQICAKVHLTRHTPEREDMSKRELLYVNSFLDVLIQSKAEEAAKKKQAPKGRDGKPASKG